MIVGRFIDAWRGRALWMRLRRRHRVDDGAYVVAFIEHDQHLNEVALAHLGDLIADRRARGVVVVTDSAWVAQRLDVGSDGVLGVELISERAIDELVSFYELYQFSARILFVSLTRPAANHLSRMLGVNGVTLDDLVCLAMFRIRNWSAEALSHA